MTDSPNRPHFSDREWARAGRVFALLSGLSLLGLALQQHLVGLVFLIRAWLGIFGVLSIYVSLHDTRR